MEYPSATNTQFEKNEILGKKKDLPYNFASLGCKVVTNKPIGGGLYLVRFFDSGECGEINIMANLF